VKEQVVFLFLVQRCFLFAHCHLDLGVWLFQENIENMNRNIQRAGFWRFHQTIAKRG